MGFKNLLMSHNKVYKETASYYHMKNPQMNERYYDNYMDYKIMPSLHVFKEDMAYLSQEQKDYPDDYAMVFFPEQMPIPTDLQEYLEKEGFEFSKHIIFTNDLANLNLKKADLGTIRIEELSPESLTDYLQLKYQNNLEFGQDYAEQMLAFNKENLPEKSSKIYIASDGDKLIGDVTAWDYGDYVEIDDFSVLEDYRGRGIGSALQSSASQGYQKVILISEEENRAMYEHQGYEEVSYYWTVLKSSRP